MAITRTAMVDDDGSGTTGTVINNAWKQEFYDQIDAQIVPLGVWTAAPYNAGDFTASSGTWTVDAGDVSVLRYTRIGKTLTVAINLANTTTSAATSVVNIKIPGGYTALGVQGMTGRLIEGASQLSCLLFTSGTNIAVAKFNPSGTIGAVTNTLSIIGTITFEIQ